MRVIKSSGITEPYDESKLLRILDFATSGTSISSHELLQLVKNQIVDNMQSKDIQKVAIKVAADQISVEEPDWQYVSARLEMYSLRKDVYNQFHPIDFQSLIEKNVHLGVYDTEILEKYTNHDIAYLESHINHDRDFTFSYAGVMQFKEKYLVKDRSSGVIFETPQYAYMLIAMCLHQDEAVFNGKRLEHVVDFYHAVSTFKVSLPTPIMGGVRTPTRQFSSCTKIESGDSLPSINKTSEAIVNYISKRAGIGVNGGAIRAEGSRIRSGEIKHTGVIPFWKHFQTAVKSCSQGGIRGGAATMNYPIWHLEAENLLVLKNNKGVEENRIRHLDYAVAINTLMIKRLSANDYITLFSPDLEGGRLYETYYSDPEEFEKLYVKLENDPTVTKKRIKAVDLFSLFGQERNGTGRLYPLFVDNVNGATPYNEPIKMTNLCVEINLPTYPMGTLEAEIALCTLAAYNLGAIKDKHEFEHLARVLVRALDNLLDYQDYPMKEAEKAKLRRSLGIGVTNFAYFLAKNFVGYNDEAAKPLVHEWFEAMSYYNIKASNELAMERGRSEWHDRTKWSEGLLPIDWYKKTVDDLIKPKYYMDWEALRISVLQWGLRNDTTSALMPCESSSQISNSTNGIEPPRSLVSSKQSKDGVFNQVVPEVELLASEYDTAWQMARKSNKGYLTLVAIMQKWVDQGISANQYWIPSLYPGGKVPMEAIIEELVFCNRYGHKSTYYANTQDGADGTEGDDCDSCKV